MKNIDNELRDIAVLFANRIGSPWGEGATYSHEQAVADEEDEVSANGNLNSHLDNKDFELFVSDLVEAVAPIIAEAERVNNLKLTGMNRVMSRVSVDENGCMIWSGPINKYGYGVLQYDDGEFKTCKVHRIAYYLFYGVNPGEMTIDHMCNVKRCVNVKHMMLATLRDNARRGNKPLDKIDYCVNGHKYTSENTWQGTATNKDGSRHSSIKCKDCDKMYKHRYRERKRLGLVGQTQKGDER